MGRGRGFKGYAVGVSSTRKVTLLSLGLCSYVLTHQQLNVLLMCISRRHLTELRVLGWPRSPITLNTQVEHVGAGETLIALFMISAIQLHNNYPSWSMPLLCKEEMERCNISRSHQARHLQPEGAYKSRFLPSPLAMPPRSSGWARMPLSLLSILQC